MSDPTDRAPFTPDAAMRAVARSERSATVASDTQRAYEIARPETREYALAAVDFALAADCVRALAGLAAHPDWLMFCSVGGSGWTVTLGDENDWRPIGTGPDPLTALLAALAWTDA